MTVYGGKEHNTGLDILRLEHACSHDSKNCTFLGIKRTNLYEGELAKTRVLWQ